MIITNHNNNWLGLILNIILFSILYATVDNISTNVQHMAKIQHFKYVLDTLPQRSTDYKPGSLILSEPYHYSASDILLMKNIIVEKLVRRIVTIKLVNGNQIKLEWEWIEYVN